MKSSRQEIESLCMSHFSNHWLEFSRRHRSWFCMVSSSARQILLNSRKGSSRLAALD